SRTAAPAKRPPAPDYALASAPATGNVNRAACYNAADLGVIRPRMVQGELNVAYLQCQGPGGRLAFEEMYRGFVTKYDAELRANANSIKQLAARKRFNVDVVVTEFFNRTSQRAPV